MKTPFFYILTFFIFGLTSCTNPFGGGSFFNVSSVELDWSNKDFDFGNQQIGSTSSKTFYISNNGNTDATDCSNVTISDVVNFSIVSQTCTVSTLAKGSQCEVVVESHPQTAGEKTLVIDRQCRVKSNLVSLMNQVRVTAVVPSAHWTPTTHSFGAIQTGNNTFSKKFVLSNHGGSPITNCGITSLSNVTDFAIISDTCGMNNLGTGSSCEITVIGRPQSAGVKATTLRRTCESNYTFSTVQDQITVNAFDSFLALYPATYDLNDRYQGTSSTAYLYLQNEITDVAVSCTPAALSDNTNYSISYDDCGTRGLTQWDGCSIYVQAESTAPVGEHITNLTKTCTFPDTSVKTISIPIRSNVLTAVPDLYVFNNSYDYGNTFVGGSGSNNTFYFYNGGSADATGCSQPTLDNTTDFSMTTNNCNGADLTVGNMCDVTVRALPLSTGLKSASLSMTCAVGGTIAAALQQNGRPSAPDLSISPSNYNYGSVAVGGNSDRVFTIQNQGPLLANSCNSPVLSNTTDFMIVGDTCTMNDVAAYGSCTTTIRAAPNSIGTKTGTLTRDCTNGGTVVANLQATGFVPAPNVAWSQSSHDYGNVNIGANSIAVTMYLYNSGTADATGCSAPALSNTTDFTIAYQSCGVSDMAAGSNCYAQVFANPQSSGLISTTLSRTCSVGGTASLQLDVTGRLTADLVENSSQTSFGEVPASGADSHDLIFYFRNKNAQGLTGCSMPTLSNTTDFAITHDDCATNNMNKATACEIRVKAHPQSFGNVTGQLTRSCAETGAASIGLSAVGVNASLPETIYSYRSGNCTILADKTMKCFGSNFNNQLAISGYANFIDTPVVTQNISNAVSLVGGESSSCALMADQSVKCWGSGYGSSPTVQSGFANNVLTMAAGYYMFCAVMSDHKVKCWGSNNYGLGDGVNNYADTTAPVTVVNLTDAVDVAIGYGHACAVIGAGPDVGKVKCWGYNGSGQLGTGGSDSATPAFVSGLTNAIKIVAGSYHNCALINDGTVKCWGANNNGISGVDPVNNTVNVVTTPQTVSMSNVVDIFSHLGSHTCAKLNTGDVKCWGDNTQNQYSVSSVMKYSYMPVTVPEFQNAKSIAVGEYSTCIIDPSSKVRCTKQAAPGFVNETSRKTLPTFIRNVPNADIVKLGSRHGCAIMNDSTVQCWGSNEYGELGDGTTTNRYTGITTVSGLSNVTKIAPSQVYTCALIGSGPDQGKVKCWGGNWGGALGNGTIGWGNMQTTPGDVINGTNMADVVATDYSYCGLVNDGTVKCWGYNNYGSIGDGTTTNSLQAKVVPGLSNVTKIAAGGTSICALLSDRTVTCWGNNTLSPTAVSGLYNVADIGVGSYHKCALLTDKTVKCWGANNYGQSGSYPGTGAPSTVGSLENVNRLIVGIHSNCAVLANGMVKCWGVNFSGDMGIAEFMPNGGIAVPQYRLNHDINADIVLVAEGTDQQACSYNRTTGDLYCTGFNYYYGYLSTEFWSMPFLVQPSGL